MAVLAKPINKMSIVKVKDSRKFVQTLNEHMPTTEFLDSCKKAGRLFVKDGI